MGVYIGLSPSQKEGVVKEYLDKNEEVRHVIVFYPDAWKHLTIDAEYTPYSEIIMYRTFYPLLQRIDSSYLLVYDECMRTQKRTDLTYNCAHKYNNQTRHIIVFEGFPFINNVDDFMILADLVDSVRMRMRKHFDPTVLDDIQTFMREPLYDFGRIDVELPDGAERQYCEEREKLFEDLGKKDPDTIPNALEVFVGRWKKPKGDTTGYVARNQRYKTDTFAMHKRIDSAKLIDLPLATKEFADWLKMSGCRKIRFLHTGLKVDTYLYEKYLEWFSEVRKFYDEASLHQRDGA